jgi:hypothetical protein
MDKNGNEIENSKKIPQEIIARKMRILLRIAVKVQKYYDKEMVFSSKYQINDRPAEADKIRSKVYRRLPITA